MKNSPKFGSITLNSLCSVVPPEEREAGKMKKVYCARLTEFTVVNGGLKGTWRGWEGFGHLICMCFLRVQNPVLTTGGILLYSGFPRDTVQRANGLPAVSRIFE